MTSKSTEQGSVADFANGYHAIAEDLRFLSLLHDRELTQHTFESLRQSSPSEWLALEITHEQARGGLALLDNEISAPATATLHERLDNFAVDFASIYLTHAYQASPFESVWLDDENLMWQTPMFEVRALYTKHGVKVEDWRRRSDDHLCHQLNFIAHLLEQANGEQDLAVCKAFMDDHICKWFGEFTDRISRRAHTLLYVGLANLTSGYLQQLSHLLSDAPWPMRAEEPQDCDNISSSCPSQNVSELNKNGPASSRL